MAANLDDLKIDRSREGTGGPGWFFVFAALLVGGAVGALGMHLFNGDAPAKGSPRPPGPVSGQTAQTRQPESRSPRRGGSFRVGGWVEPAYPYPKTVSSLVAGRVEDVLVQDGQKVAKGDVIARIYDRDFRERLEDGKAELEVLRKKHAVEKARLALLEAGYRKQDIEEAEARLAELAAEVDLWKRLAERSRRLAGRGADSVEKAETDQATYETKKARHKAQAALVSKLREGVRREEIDHQRARVAEAASRVVDEEAHVKLKATALEYTVVRAPVDGVVLRVFRDIGDRVGPGSPESARIAWLYDPARLWVRADVSQAELSRVRLDAAVEVRVKASDKVYRGRVVRKNPLADLAKNTVEVKVEILDPDDLLHPEMTAHVTFLPLGGAARKAVRRGTDRDKQDQ